MQKKRSKRRRRLHRRVLIFIGVVAVGGIVGLSLTTDTPAGTVVTKYGPPLKERAQRVMQALGITEEEWEVRRSRGLRRVTKYINEGIVQRIDEVQRRLFINDPVWFAMSRGGQENVARVVAGYLDVVNDVRPGTVAVFSFRTGRIVAEVNGGGAYVVFQ